MSRSDSLSDAFAQIDELAAIADACLSEPQRTIYRMTTDIDDPQTCEEIAQALSMSDRNVRYHRAQARLKVTAAYNEKREGRFRCAVTVRRGNEAIFETDTTAQQAIIEADRSALSPRSTDCRRAA